MKIKKNYLFFNINNINQAIEAIIICKKNKMLPVICIKFFIVGGFGPDWIKELRNLLLKKFNKRDFKILVDCRKNYGLFINLVQQKIDFLQVKAEPNTLFRLKNIANKNIVTVNPKINIINLSNIKKIKSKIQKIYKA